MSLTREPPCRQPTNWRTIIPKKFSHYCESSRAHNRFSSLGNPAKGLRNSREFDFEGQWDLITELPHEWGNRLPEGTNKTLWATRPRRKEQWHHKKLSQSCLWVSRNLQQRQRSTAACPGVRGTEYKSLGISPLEGGCYYCYYLYSCLMPNYREETQPHPSTENWIKVLPSMATPNKARPRFSDSQSLLSGSFHKPLILLHQRRADRIETTIIEN